MLIAGYLPCRSTPFLLDYSPNPVRMECQLFLYNITGLTKQDYITRRLLCKDVVVQGNPRVYKALRDQFAAVLDELRRIEAGEGVNDELIDTINLIASIMDGMKEDDAYGN